MLYNDIFMVCSDARCKLVRQYHAEKITLANYPRLKHRDPQVSVDRHIVASTGTERKSIYFVLYFFRNRSRTCH